MLLVVGLDGASYDLCERWIEQGHLPNLARIKQGGAWLPLQSTIPAVSPVAWSTFMTGTNPGEHGVFGFFVPERPRPHQAPTRFRPVNSRDCRGQCFWEKMNEAGLSTGIVGVPVTYPVRHVNGHMVAGLLAPGLTAPGATYPPELGAEIRARVGPYRIAPRGVYAPSSKRALIEELHACLGLRGELAQYLLENHRCDVHVFVFYETDVVQHKMWQFMDSSHPRYTCSGSNKWGSAIRDIYSHADSIVGTLMQRLGSDDTLVVMSDHGAGALHGTFHLNSWLREEGYLVCRRGWRRWVMKVEGGLGSVQLCARIARRLGLLSKIGLGQQTRRLLSSGFLRAGNIDWEQTVAYGMGFEGAVYTVGERHSTVAREIAERLRSLRDPRTGELLIESIYPARELYRGQLVESAPSLILRMAGGRYNVSQKPFARELVGPSKDSGAHSQTGILGVLGPGVGALDQRSLFGIEQMAQFLLQVTQAGSCQG